MRWFKYLFLIGLLLYIPILITSSGYDDPPRILLRVEPEYPESAIEQGIEGTVVLEVEILEDGSVGEAKVLRSLMPGEGGLDEAALAAVHQWKFTPAIPLGTNKPMVIKARVPIEFILDETTRQEQQRKLAEEQRKRDSYVEEIPQQYIWATGFRFIHRGGFIPSRDGRVVVNKRVLPEYTESAREIGIEGYLELDAEILEDGTITNIRVHHSLMPGEEGLDEVAIEALKKWEVEPLSGIRGREYVPMKVDIRVRFDFDLENGEEKQGEKEK